MRRTVMSAILVATLLGAGCGGDSDGDDETSGDGADGDGASGDGASGDDGTSADGDGSSGDGTSGDGTGGDGASDGRDPSGECRDTDTTCTDAELDAYSSCFARECGAANEKCFGEGYLDGEYGGPCGDWVRCTEACPCDDTACFTACGQPSDACTSCLVTASSCAEEKCPAPACLSESPGDGTDPGDGSFTCDDLAACCASIADANTKGSCEQGYEQAKMTGDTACGVLYTSFVQAQFCE